MVTELLTLNCVLDENDNLMITQAHDGLIEFSITNEYETLTVALNDNQLKELIHTLTLKVG